MLNKEFTVISVIPCQEGDSIFSLAELLHYTVRMTVLLWLISCPEIILKCVLIISKYQDFCTFCMFSTVSFPKLYWMCGLIVVSVLHYVLNVHVQYICCFYRELMKLHHAYMTDKVCDWFQNIIFFCND